MAVSITEIIIVMLVCYIPTYRCGWKNWFL